MKPVVPYQKSPSQDSSRGERATKAADEFLNSLSDALEEAERQGNRSRIRDEDPTRSSRRLSSEHANYDYAPDGVIDISRMAGSPDEVLKAQVEEMGLFSRAAFRLYRSSMSKERAQELFSKILDLQVESALFNAELAKDLATSRALVEYLREKPAIAMEISAVRAEFKRTMLSQLFDLRDRIYDLRNERFASVKTKANAGRYTNEDVRREYVFAQDVFKDELAELEFEFRSAFAEYLTHLINKIGGAVRLMGDRITLVGRERRK